MSGLLVTLPAQPASAAPVGAPPSRIAGSVVAFGGDNDSSQNDVPASLTGQGVAAVAAGSQFDLALTVAGSVVTWGDIQSPPDSLIGQRVTAVAAGYTHALALTAAGTVVAWGDDSQDETDVPADLNQNVAAIAAGDGFSVALTDYGTVETWGNNAPTVPYYLPPVSAISASSGYVTALLSDGSVTAFGNDAYGDPVTADVAAGNVAVAAGPSTGFALTSDGTVQPFGKDVNGDADPPSFGNHFITAVAAGATQLALAQDGSLFQWGPSDDSLDAGLAALANQHVTAVAVGPNDLHAIAIVRPAAITTGPTDDFETEYISDELGNQQDSDDTNAANCSTDAPDNSAQYDQAMVGLGADIATEYVGEDEFQSVAGAIVNCRPFVGSTPTLDDTVAPTQQRMSGNDADNADYAPPTDMCPTGQVVTGLDVNSGDSDSSAVSDLRPYCSSLDDQGRTRDDAQPQAWLNGDSGTSDGTVSCPIGSFVVSIQGDTSNVVDTIGIICNAPIFTVADAQPDNSAWTTARTLAANDSTTQALTSGDGALWYKFPVQPNSTVKVDLTNLPANDDLAVFSDISQAYATLNSTQDLNRIGAESASVSFSPTTFSPTTFSPTTFSPTTFSPTTFSPTTFSPTTFSPYVTPDDYTNSGAFTDTSTFEQAYSSAQTRSVLAVSANDGLQPESVSLNTGTHTGDFYMRVTARNGVGSADPYTLSVASSGGPCTTTLDDYSGDSTITGAPGSASTVVLTDSSRLNDPAGSVAAADSAFAANVTGGAAIVDLADSPRVQALDAQADAHPECPYAKDLVADSIRDIVNSYRDASGTLKYVVIQGGDNVVPYFRYADQAGIADESGFVPPVADGTASASQLDHDLVLSQDAYGSAVDLAIGGGTLPVPDLAVGRLVGGAAQIATTLDNFVNGTTAKINVSSSLATGYDFMADASKQIAATFQAGDPTGTNDSLITNNGVSRSDTTVDGNPSPTTSWTATDLQKALLTKRHDLIYLAAHFSPNLAEAADYATAISTHDVAAASPTPSKSAFLDSLVISPGCHSGYDIVDPDAVTGVTDPLDWTTEFAEQGATLIAGTGYQYGDTDFVKYSNQLYVYLANELRTGSGPVSVGSALVAAKADYLAGQASLDGIDEKSLEESTLYGLPMQTISMPSQTPAPTAPAPLATTAATSDPGQTLGLSSAAVTVTPDLTTHPHTLTSTGGGSVQATYLSGDNGVESKPAAPALPLVTQNATAPAGTALRGVGFWSGSYTDTTGVTPLTGAPATETNTTHGPFVSSVFYPDVTATPNYFGALTGRGGTSLQVTPAQYVSDGPGSLTDTQRAYSALGYHLFYSGNRSTYGDNTPALAAPPSMSGTTAAPSADGGSVTFSTHVIGDPSAGIQDVWVTWTDPKASGTTKHWASLELTQDSNDSTLWTGTLELPSGDDASDVRYLVQAVNGVGVVGADDNAGHYYQPTSGTAVNPDASTLHLQPAPASVTPGTSATVSATLSTPGSNSVAGQPVTFTLGGSSVIATTNSAGLASAAVPVTDAPGSISLAASFPGSALLAPASDGPVSVTVAKRSANLALSTDSSGATVTLTDTTAGAGGVGVPSHTVFVVATAGDATVLKVFALQTDALGTASVSAATIPSRTTDLQAYFGSAATPSLHGTFDQTDPIYRGATSPLIAYAPTMRYPVTATLPVGRGPKAVAVDQRTHAAYVANSGDDTVSAIDDLTNTVSPTTTAVGSVPVGVAVDPTIHTAYVVNYGANTVSAIDERTNSVTATINVGQDPYGVAVDQRTHTVFVANYGDDTVSVIDETTNAVSATVRVGTHPYAVAVNPRTHTGYVTNEGDQSVSVIDEATRTVTATLGVGGLPDGLAVDPVTRNVYVANADDGTVSVINGSTNTVVGTVGVGAQPVGVAVDPGTHIVYVTNYGDDTLSVINEAGNSVADTVDVGSQPVAVAVDPKRHSVYVANYGDDTVSVLSPSGLISQQITFTSRPPKRPQPGDTYAVTATGGGSGNPVTFAATAAAANVCSVTGNSGPDATGTYSASVKFTAQGTCVVTAKQTGNSSYASAPGVKQHIRVR